jgi:uncharacterized protein YprB with RNaseH-like and TPR domain
LNKIDDLVGLSRDKNNEASHIIKSISCKDVENLKKIKNITEEDLLFCVNPEEILFVDIETTGQTSAQIFLIGTGYFEPKTVMKAESESFNLSKLDFVVDLIFAREISEEAAILKYFIDLLPKYRMLVTYNGKHFDIPFICDRVGSLLENSDLQDVYNTIIGDANSGAKDTKNNNQFASSYEKIKHICSKLIHFDLYYAIKRTYRDVLRNFRLKTVEEQILEFFRVDHLASEFVPQIYLEWLEDNAEKMGALYKVMEHNFYDVQNLARILKEWIHCRIDESTEQVGYKIKKKFGLESLTTSKNELQMKKKSIYDDTLQPFKYHHTRTTTLDEFFK